MAGGQPEPTGRDTSRHAAHQLRRSFAADRGAHADDHLGDQSAQEAATERQATVTGPESLVDLGVLASGVPAQQVPGRTADCAGDRQRSHTSCRRRPLDVALEVARAGPEGEVLEGVQHQHHEVPEPAGCHAGEHEREPEPDAERRITLVGVVRLLGGAPPGGQPAPDQRGRRAHPGPRVAPDDARCRPPAPPPGASRSGLGHRPAPERLAAPTAVVSLPTDPFTGPRAATVGRRSAAPEQSPRFEYRGSSLTAHRYRGLNVRTIHAHR